MCSLLTLFTTKWLDLFETALIYLSFVQRWVVHVWIVCEKNKLKGVILICDKALSSKYVYSLEDYKHNPISIIGSFLKKSFF